MKDLLQVDFWDVGYGDASVIWLNSKEVVLIDCGPHNSPLPFWLVKHGITVRLVVLTHNDADHFEGFLQLMRMIGHQVGAYAMHQDRAATSLKRACKELEEGCQKGWPEPIAVYPRTERPQDLLAEAGIASQLFQLLAFYPSQLSALIGQLKGPNCTSSLIGLMIDGKPAVVWPGDLPLKTCEMVLSTANLKPLLLVGPHHGGPEDIGELDAKEIDKAVSVCGHKNNWISVAWHEGREHPLPEYIRALVKAAVDVRCSELTYRCEDHPEKWGRGLLPTHDWLGLERPPSGTSCMGCMRVMLGPGRIDILFAREHRSRAKMLGHPLCR